jgi:hypothetical protein
MDCNEAIRCRQRRLNVERLRCHSVDRIRSRQCGDDERMFRETACVGKVEGGVARISTAGGVVAAYGLKQAGD